MTFLEHLEELRWTLMRSTIAISVVAIALFVMKDLVFDKIVLAPKEPGFLTYRALCSLSHDIGLGDSMCMGQKGLSLQNISMSGQFMTHLVVSMVGGIVVAFPYILWEIWRFIKPGLRVSERNSLGWVVWSGSLLFFSGILFGYYMIAPLSIQFLGGYQVSSTVQNIISLNSYISTVTSVTLATGVLFELPLVVLFLTRAGLVTPAFLRTYRKHAFVIVLVLSAIITPPDVASQILVSLPLMVLYEAGIALSARTLRRMENRSKGGTEGMHT